MRELLNVLLSELGYLKEKESELYDFFSNRNKNSFYAIAYIDSFADLQNEDSGWRAAENDALNHIVTPNDRGRIINNCNMIFCVKENDRSDTIEHLIYDLEEDRLGFRKLVLSYSKRELDDFEEKIRDASQKGFSTLEFIKQIIRDNDMFTEYRKEQEESFFSLILKLYIKLPTLVYTVESEAGRYTDLQSTINQLIKDDGLSDFANLLDKNILTLNDKEIRCLDSADSIIKLLGEDINHEL